MTVYDVANSPLNLPAAAFEWELPVLRACGFVGAKRSQAYAKAIKQCRCARTDPK